MCVCVCVCVMVKKKKQNKTGSCLPCACAGDEHHQERGSTHISNSFFDLSFVSSFILPSLKSTTTSPLGSLNIFFCAHLAFMSWLCRLTPLPISLHIISALILHTSIPLTSPWQQPVESRFFWVQWSASLPPPPPLSRSWMTIEQEAGPRAPLGIFDFSISGCISSPKYMRCRKASECWRCFFFFPQAVDGKSRPRVVCFSVCLYPASIDFLQHWESINQE